MDGCAHLFDLKDISFTIYLLFPPFPFLSSVISIFTLGNVDIHDLYCITYYRMSPPFLSSRGVDFWVDIYNLLHHHHLLQVLELVMINYMRYIYSNPLFHPHTNPPEFFQISLTMNHTARTNNTRVVSQLPTNTLKCGISRQRADLFFPLLSREQMRLEYPGGGESSAKGSLGINGDPSSKSTPLRVS